MTAVLTDNLPLLAGAPNGIKKLRELILSLAVKGRLLPVACGVDSEIPNGWICTNVGAMLAFEYGDNLPAAKRSNTGEYPVYGSNGVVGSHNECFVKEPCIVIGRKGSAGALNISMSSGCCVTDVAYYCVPPKTLSLEFTFKLLQTLGLDALGKGIKPGLSRKEAYALEILVPPFDEQHRIAAKVDELMALCDTLEFQQAGAESAHAQLVQALLDSLTKASDADDFAASWQRLSEHFDTLFTTEASIDALKQTVLQLAVMGKLVPQDSGDEPVRQLLRRIEAEKRRLSESGKLKGNKQPAPNPGIESPFNIPTNWLGVNLADVVALVTDGDHQPPPTVQDGVPFLVIGNLNKGRIVFDGCRKVSREYYDALDWTRKPDKGDILYTVTGSLGISVVIEADQEFCVQRHVAILKTVPSTPKSYLSILLESKFAKAYAVSIATGIAQKTVPLTGLRKLFVPLPPKEEQHRIVTKVDELMAICDQLKSRLRQARDLNQQLASTLVERAVA